MGQGRSSPAGGQRSFDLREPTLHAANGLAGHELEWKRYDASADKEDWVAVEPQAKAEAEAPATFKLISFNVWFSTHRQLSRTRALLELLEREDASVVCLQEATARFLRLVLASEYVQRTYCISSSIREFESLNSDVGYDCFMLAKPSLTGRLVRYQLTSVYGRKLLLNVLPWFGVGTVHLESNVNRGAGRSQQMGEIYGLLEEHAVLQKSFFCGDLNHCISQGENHLRQDVSRDVWPKVHPDQPGWTENAEINGMLAAKSGHHPLVRFDRIVMNGDPAGLQPVAMKILGDEPVLNLQHDEAVEESLREAPVFVSDHFGVAATFQRQQ